MAAAHGDDGHDPERARDLEERAARVVARLRDAGHRALFAGGCVRDRLLGRRVNDIDIATSARPDEVARLFPRTIGVGAQFGVMIVVDRARGKPQERFEVATFRADGAYGDARRPDSVAWSDDREDALRRDFTVNALFWDPIEARVIDHVGGLADIEARVLRAVGDPRARFAEDHLRLLRAARFAARLGFRIDDATAAAARALAPSVATVSAERIRDEMTKIIVHASRRIGLELAHDLGLLAIVLPEVTALAGVAQQADEHPEGDAWAHTLLVLERLGAAPSPTLAWAALLHDIGKVKTLDRPRHAGHDAAGAAMALDVATRLRMSNERRDRIVALVRQHLRFAETAGMRESELKRFLRQDGFDEHLELQRADCLASHGHLDDWERCRRRLDDLARAAPEDGLRPPPLVTGDDLKTWGMRPGPAFKAILTAVEDAQLEGRIRTKDDARTLIERDFPDAAPTR